MVTALSSLRLFLYITAICVHTNMVAFTQGGDNECCPQTLLLPEHFSSFTVMACKRNNCHDFIKCSLKKQTLSQAWWSDAAQKKPAQIAIVNNDSMTAFYDHFKKDYPDLTKEGEHSLVMQYKYSCQKNGMASYETPKMPITLTVYALHMSISKNPEDNSIILECNTGVPYLSNAVYINNSVCEAECNKPTLNASRECSNWETTWDAQKGSCFLTISDASASDIGTCCCRLSDSAHFSQAPSVCINIPARNSSQQCCQQADIRLEAVSSLCGLLGVVIVALLVVVGYMYMKLKRNAGQRDLRNRPPVDGYGAVDAGFR